MSGRPRSLTHEDECLILALKVQRSRLRRQAAELTDKKIAEKFDVCAMTIARLGYPDQAQSNPKGE